MSIEEQFHAAVKVIRSLPKNGSFQPSPELKLTFYAYFKQATEGPNESKKPPFYDVVNRYKWEAWTRVSHVSKEQAMTCYVDELKKVIETVSLTQEVSNFLDVLGPFYEYLPEEVTNKSPNKSSSGNGAPGLQETMDDPVITNNGTCFNTYDSDGDEFSDTVDCTLPQNDKISVFAQNGISNHIDTRGGKIDLDNFKQATVATKDSSDVMPKLANGTSGKVVSNNTFAPMASINDDSFGFNEQLTMAMFRLQHGLDRVMNRMDALESVVSHQSRLDKQRSASASALSKWLFPEMSTRTTAFVIAWPLVVYLALNYVKQMRKK